MPIVDVTFRRTNAGWTFSGWVAWIIGELTVGGTAAEETALLASVKSRTDLAGLMLARMTRDAPAFGRCVTGITVERGYRFENNLRTRAQMTLRRRPPAGLKDLVFTDADVAALGESLAGLVGGGPTLSRVFEGLRDAVPTFS